MMDTIICILLYMLTDLIQASEVDTIIISYFSNEESEASRS